MGATMNLGERVAQAFWVSVIVCSLIGLWVYLGTPANDGEPTRWERLCVWFSEHYLAPKASNIYVASNTDEEPGRRTDARTDVGPSALRQAIETKDIDIIREVIIDSLVSEGADVAFIRSILKGSNDAIGAEVAAARERLGISLPERKLLVRDNGEPAREIAFK